MELLQNPIRNYAWGSHTAIARVLGKQAPTEQPEAELWIGAHPAAPSVVLHDGRGLDEVLAADPVGLLGTDDARLPFLLKLLAADEPLSLQAHPSAAAAKAGFERGDENYVDAHHKPELLCAVSEFDALCGFRPIDEAVEVLAGLPALVPYADRLRDDPTPDGLRAVVADLLTTPPEDRADLVGAVVKQAGPGYELATELGERYPADVGVIVALLLNRLTLQPGEAVWMPAGNLHAYLHGIGVEVMACSDNVLRGGLTPKRVDVPELLEILDVAPGRVEPFPYTEPNSSLRVWSPPVDEFQLTRVEPACDVVTLPAGGPALAFVLVGTASLDDGTAELGIRDGEAVFVPAGVELTVSGDATVFHATTAP